MRSWEGGKMGKGKISNGAYDKFVGAFDPHPPLPLREGIEGRGN
ncbi:MAG: hypothetical protein Q7T53_05790 [Deltaproteobacteria bacterium]|nr:hypothetical protein [Deltaproteobacteria bacterium]